MNKKVNESLIKDNLYMAVNGEWLKTAKIPADKPLTGGFADLADNIEKTLMHDFEQLNSGELNSDDPYLLEFLKYYKLAMDFSKRDTAGFEPARTYLKKIEDLKNLSDWEKQLTDLTLAGYPSPIPLYVEPDMKNTKLYALYAGVPNLILPDKTYYSPENPSSEKLLQIYSTMLKKLLNLAGYSEEFTQKTIAGALAFDKSLVAHVKDSTELADYVKSYNKYSLTKFVNFSQHFDVRNYITALLKHEPDQVIVTEPKYYAALNDIVNEKTFINMKSWLLVKTILSVSPYLSDKIRIVAGTYSRAISGSKEPMNPTKSAYYLATSQFDQVVGLYYAHKYFGEAAKKDVTAMVKKMADIYKNRLSNNTWLSKDTREKAVVKLEKLGIQVGYPDKLDPLYKRFKVKAGNLLENSLTFDKIALKDHYSKWNKNVDRTRWEMSAHTVNAYYNPSYNVIVFPAAILQAPFYSFEQSASENYGGIGAVIAHEISHAFDNNGAHFDELGNLHNWWTKQDLDYFSKLSQKMITEFDGLKTPAGKVNGKLVVSENIADAGGLSCALEAVKSDPSADLKTFFYNWARVWCMKSSLERQKLLLAIDVHAPHELRANVQPQNLVDFYKTFNIRPEDGMYLEPEKRVNIW